MYLPKSILLVLTIVFFQNILFCQNCFDERLFFHGFQFDTTIVRPQQSQVETNNAQLNMAWVNYYHKKGETDSSLQYIRNWISEINSDKNSELFYQVNLLLGERVQYSGDWELAKTQFENLVDKNQAQYLLLYKEYNLIKLYSKLKPEGYDWMKNKISNIWKGALEQNEEIIISSLVPIVLAYDVVSLNEIETLQLSNPIAFGRLKFHITNNQPNDSIQLQKTIEYSVYISDCNPLFKFKSNALIAYLNLKTNNFNSVLPLLKENENYCRVLNDSEVWKHQYELYAKYYQLIGNQKMRKEYGIKIENIEKNLNILRQQDDLTRKISNELSKANEDLNKSYNTLLIFLVVISLLLILVFYLAWKSYHNSNKLKKSNSNLNQLFQIISHDFQSPLSNAILALRKDNPNLNNAEQHLMHLRSRTNEILSWTSRNLDETQVKKETLGLEELVLDELEIQYFEISKVKLSIDEDLVIKTDKDLFSIVLRNLIDNAFKYSCNKGLIYISAIEKNGKIQLIISNEVDNSKSKGSQQGLILVKEIANLLGIKFYTENKPNQPNKTNKPNQFTATLIFK